MVNKKPCDLYHSLLQLIKLRPSLNVALSIPFINKFLHSALKLHPPPATGDGK